MTKASALKRLTATFFFTAAVFYSVSAFAATTLYEQMDEQILANGINYQYKHRLTDEGWLDIHVLTADISNPNITVNPVESSKELGLKETTDALLNEHDAVAGVNSGYFGMNGNYSASFGPVIASGDIVSIDTDKNFNANQFGTMFIKDDQNPMLGYFKTTMNFVVEGTSYFELASINKVTEMKYPMIVDATGAKNTLALDARFSNLTKVVVENDRITYISTAGENVNVPENGYVLILDESYTNAYKQYMAVGQSVKIDVSCNFNLDNIETAVSGGGIILDNGEKAADLGEISTGRQPRTLLGISQDKKTIKLITVDGVRTGGSNVSIGLTPDECVAMLKAEGMYYGLNLDGGGSTTMAVSDDYGTAKIVNNPAEGAARKVMTAVGIFDSSTIGEIETLVVESNSKSAAPSGTINISVYGYDSNHHKIMLNASDVQFMVENGTLSGNTITVGESGNVDIRAAYKNISTEIIVPISPIVSISPSKGSITVNQGESATFEVMATAEDGTKIDVTNKVAVTSSFGTVSGNTYTAPSEKGGGLITIEYNGLTAYIKVSVGSEVKQINSFENIQYLNFTSYPEGIDGIAGLTTKYVSDGSKALGLSYYFKESTSTQTAYLTIPKGIDISGEPSRLVLDIYGNGTGQWVRAKISDANGNESVIDFSRDVSWNGEYMAVTADVPSGVAYPIKLNTIYIAALSNTNTSQQVMYFDNLRGEYGADYGVEVPKAVTGTDKLLADLGGSKEAGYYYANITGRVSSGSVEDKSLYDSTRTNVRSILETGTDVAVYAGKADVESTGAVETIKWANDYGFYNKNGIDFVNLTAVNGGLKSSKASQWQTFKNDVLSTNNKCVVFIMDTTPSNFSDNLETELFRSVLQEIKDNGKTVFVVSAAGTGYWSTIKDGIRYINLGSLWLDNGGINKEFRMLRIRVNGDSINYQVEKLY